MKTCSICKDEKPTIEFNKDKQTKDGFSGRCRSCANSYKAEWHLDNPEKAKAEYSNWASRYPEKVRARNIAWALANPEKKRASVINWNKENQDKRTGYEAKRRAILEGITATLTNEEWLQTLQDCDYECIYCGAPWEHRDHFVALSNGGEHTKENVVPACKPCNLRKKDKDPLEFIASLEPVSI